METMIEDVRKLSVQERLFYWITERESIRLKKEANEPKPWTHDEILSSYRFSNVRRMDDTVSSWLLDNWYRPYHNHRNMLQAVALARFFNKPESLAVIEDLVFVSGRPNWERIKHAMREYRDEGNTVFNGAYMVRGNDGADKIECVVDWYVAPLEVLNTTLVTESMREAWTQLQGYYGMGSFMAGQIVADLRHAKIGRWKDRKIWAPIGPGSQRGMNRYLGRPISRSMSQSEFLHELRKVIHLGIERLPEEITDRLEACDWQGSFCELDKFERALWGEGSPKQRYNGKADV